MTGTAVTLLTTQFTGRPLDFTSFLRLGIALALIGHELLHIEINDVVIRFNSEDSLVESHLAAGLLTFDIQYTNFHVTYSQLRLNHYIRRSFPSQGSSCAPELPLTL